MAYWDAFALGAASHTVGLVVNPFCESSDEGRAWRMGYNNAKLDSESA